MSSSIVTSDVQPQKWALLIGINAYPAWPKKQLKGCINDVNAIERLLLSEQFAFPPQNIVKLTSPADDPAHLASRDNILTTVRAHLAGNRRIGPADSVVIYYSGHGAQVPDSDDDEEDGWDETIVPCDVGPDRNNPADVLDITDDEIAALLDELGERTKDISVIFDSCHSGTVTRALFDAEDEDGEGQTRWLPPATCKVQRPHRQAITRAMGPAAWLPLSDNYTVISACRASEFAGEDSFRLSYLPPQWEWHGVLTYFLLKALRDLAPDSTYRDIWPPVQASTHQKRGAQTPQIEGTLDRKVFGGAVRPRMRQVSVAAKQADTVTLAAGVVHGATTGSRYAIYAPGTTKFEDIEKRVAVIRLGRVDIFDSTGTLETGHLRRVVIGAPAVEIDHNYGSMQKVVRILGDEHMLAELRAAIKTSPLLRLAESQDEPSDMTVRLRRPFRSDGSEDTSSPVMLHILSSSDGHGLVAPVTPDNAGPATVCEKLEHIARFHNTLGLGNLDPHSKLEGKVRLHLWAIVGQDQNGKEQLVPVNPNEGGDRVLEVGDRVVIFVENQSDQALHITILDFDTAWGINRLFPPEGATDDMVQPRQTRRIKRFRINLPDYQKPVDPNLPRPQETLKLIAATDRVDVGSLLMSDVRGDLPQAEGSSSSLYVLMRQALGGGSDSVVRSFEEDADPFLRDWTTDTLRLHIIT